MNDVFGIVRPEEWLTFEHKVPTGVSCVRSSK